MVAIATAALALTPALAAAATANPYLEPVESLASGRGYPAAVPLPNGDVLVAGGYFFSSKFDHFGQGTKTAVIFDPASGTFSATGSMAQPHWRSAAAALGDGRVLITGGLTGSEFQENINHTEIYDPASGEFSEGGSMSVERWEAFGASLPNGRVIVGGGYHFVTEEGHRHVEPLASTETYDPASEEFSAGPAMLSAGAATAAPLPDGRVLVIHKESAEIFDPATGTFSAGPTPAASAFLGSAAAIPGGPVVVRGLEAIQVYDPSSEAFSDAGLTEVKNLSGAGLAALPDGRIFFAGRIDSKFGAKEKEASVLVTAPSPQGAGIDFGEVPVSETTGPEALTITNRGAQALAVEAVALTGADAADFEVVADGCTGETLAFGEACEVQVSVTPSSSEPLGAAVTLTDNAPTSPESFALSANAPEAPIVPAAGGGGGGGGADAGAGEEEAGEAAGAVDAAAATASSGRAAATASRVAAAPKSKRTCRRAKAVGKHHAARQSRAHCTRPGPKGHRRAARHSS